MGEWQEAPGHPVRTRIGQAVMLHRAGDREEARNRLARLWEEGLAEPDPLRRCTIAHFLAGTQEDPAAELWWDLRALAEADAATAARSCPEARALYPALHLRLAADHARLGDASAARWELARAQTAAAALRDDDYGTGVRAAIGRLARTLERTPPG